MIPMTTSNSTSVKPVRCRKRVDMRWGSLEFQPASGIVRISDQG
jgi:hypothetical protein